jgi:hypothetical protein
MPKPGYRDALLRIAAGEEPARKIAVATLRKVAAEVAKKTRVTKLKVRRKAKPPEAA